MAPLYEFGCRACRIRFEKLLSSSETEASHGTSPVACPQCGSSEKVEKLISKFAVGGQGDLRESTLHGCHDCEVSLDGQPPHSGHHHDS